MTDFETGVSGESPVPEEHLAVYITAEANLRVEPVLSADIVAVVPLGASFTCNRARCDRRMALCQLSRHRGLAQ